MNRIVIFSKRGWPRILPKQQWLSCKTSSVVALSGMAFTTIVPRPLVTLTFFYGDFLSKESTEITQEDWRSLNIILSRLLLALTSGLCKTAKYTVKRVNACLQRGGRHLQHLLLCQLVYHILDIFDKMKKWFMVLGCVLCGMSQIYDLLFCMHHWS